jgi:ubiquinone/menaquinone biosynthesis C-methylase UbiE
MSEITPKQVKAGQAMYGRRYLAVYDWVVGLMYRFVDRCPPRHVLDLYNEHVSANHLDVGVATGAILDHCAFPASNPRLALMDLNPNSLAVAAKRLARYHPETYIQNALDSIRIDVPPFDSVGIANLLHCLPGTMATKRVVFDNLKAVLKPGGRLFGCTVLYRGVERSPLATTVLWFSNARGYMTNKQDDLDGMKRNLAECFSESSVKVVGCVALFSARK